MRWYYYLDPQSASIVLALLCHRLVEGPKNCSKMAISIALQKHFYCPALYENHTLKIVSSKEERGKKENASLAVCME
jgi:hypothetical protein